MENKKVEMGILNVPCSENGLIARVTVTLIEKDTYRVIEYIPAVFEISPTSDQDSFERPLFIRINVEDRRTNGEITNIEHYKR